MSDNNTNNGVNNIKKQYYDRKKKGFAENNPGRPEGSKNKLTLLKEKLAKYAEENINFDEEHVMFTKDGTKYAARALPKLDILKLAVSLIPKEQKIEHSGEGIVLKVVDFSKAQEADGDTSSKQ